MRLAQGNTPWRQTIAGSKVLTCQFFSSCSWCYCSAAAAATITTGAVNLERGQFLVLTTHAFPHHCRSKKSRSIRTGAMQRCVQRRIAVVVFAENQIRIVFEQRLDFFPSLASLRTSNPN